VLLLAALFALGARAWFVRYPSSSLERLVARAVWLSLLIAALHSAVDYPLRTTADAGVFAMLFAIALSHAWPRTPTGPEMRVEPDMPEGPTGTVSGSNIYRINR
jgi:hypothetical protein